jgi:hypothetical protein
MTNKINISIPIPCHENWQEMTVVDRGRFCNSCQKKVTDFSKKSDREIVNIFNENENLCGRFNATQLNRDLIKPKEKSTIWIAASIAIISFLTVGNNKSTAQNKSETVQTDATKTNEPEAVNPNPEKEINGIVSDISGILPAVNIVIRGTNKATQTDLDGKFKIKAKTGDVLVVSFIGLEDVAITLGKADIYNIKMEAAVMELTQGICITTLKKSTFFGRLFHKIGNWFR